MAAGIKAMKGAKVSEAFVLLPQGTSIASERLAADVSMAVTLADYSFDIYINDEGRKFHMNKVTLVCDGAAGDAAAAAYHIAAGQCAARDLANTRAGVATPQYGATRACPWHAADFVLCSARLGQSSYSCFVSVCPDTWRTGQQSSWLSTPRCHCRWSTRKK